MSTIEDVLTASIFRHPVSVYQVFTEQNSATTEEDEEETGVESLPDWIFQIDESARIATVVWQDAPGPYSFWGGSINRLSNGNVEFDMSAPFPGIAESRVLEVTPTDLPQTVWQMDIQGGNAYRAYRIPSLYPGVSWK